MKIGGWFKDCDKIQKFVRKDPHSHIPFYEAGPCFPSKVETSIAVVIVVLIVGMWVLI